MMKTSFYCSDIGYFCVAFFHWARSVKLSLMVSFNPALVPAVVRTAGRLTRRYGTDLGLSEISQDQSRDLRFVVVDEYVSGVVIALVYLAVPESFGSLRNHGPDGLFVLNKRRIRSNEIQKGGIEFLHDDNSYHGLLLLKGSRAETGAKDPRSEPGTYGNHFRIVEKDNVLPATSDTRISFSTFFFLASACRSSFLTGSSFTRYLADVSQWAQSVRLARMLLARMRLERTCRRLVSG